MLTAMPNYGSPPNTENHGKVIELIMGQLMAHDLNIGEISHRKAMQHWEKSIKLDPTFTEPKVELAQRLHNTHDDAAVTRGIELMRSAYKNDPNNEQVCNVYSAGLKSRAHSLRQNTAGHALAQESWKELGTLADDKTFKSTITTAVWKWQAFTADLRTQWRMENEQQAPSIDQPSPPPHCLGRVKEWSLGSGWPNAKPVQRMKTRTTPAAEKALWQGRREPVILKSDVEPKLTPQKLDQAFATSFDALVEVTITHDNGAALEISDAVEWQYDELVSKELTYNHFMPPHLKRCVMYQSMRPVIVHTWYVSYAR